MTLPPSETIDSQSKQFIIDRLDSTDAMPIDSVQDDEMLKKKCQDEIDALYKEYEDQEKVDPETLESVSLIY